jgi:hypothetical protein
MNIPLFISIIFLLLINGYFVALPLSKKRPVLIKNVGIPLYTFTLFSIVSSLSNIFFLAVGILIAIFFYMKHAWFVFGISKEEILATLKKAANLTRSDMKETGGNYLIDNGSMKIQIICLNKKTNFIIFKELCFSKKANLSKEVVRKFIQNYIMK